MSVAPSDHWYPRCQALLASGAITCSTCGLALGGASRYDASQAPTVYAPHGAPALAPTVASALYPQEGGNLAVPPGSPPPVASASQYAGSQAPSSHPPAGAPYGPPLARRKGRRGLWIALAVLAVVLVAGVCGVSYYVVNLLSSAHAAQAACDDYKNGDYSAFYQQSTPELQSQFGPEDQYVAAQQQWVSLHRGVVSCTVTSLNQNGSTATGTAVFTYGDGSQETVDFQYVLENGVWKLNQTVIRGG